MARAQSPRQALSFSGIKLQNWRNFTSVSVPLQRRVFVIGPNASGKSNLLDVFHFLRDIASAGGGFQDAVRRRGGVSRIRCLAARRYPSVGIEVTVGEDDDTWEYLLRFRQDNQRVPLLEKEKVCYAGKVILDRPDKDDEIDPERLKQTHLEQVSANVKFRKLAALFASVRYLHTVPQSIRNPTAFSSRERDPYGSDLIERIAKTSSRTRNAWLRRIIKALQFAVPQLEELELWRDERGTPHLRGKYKHWRAQGAWQEEADFSDGTLRLMGILWSLLESGGPLLLEEPELSLHPGVVEHLPQMLAQMQQRTGRQTLISTHSPDLLRDEGIGLDEVLLLEPGKEGTQGCLASDHPQVKALVEGGLSLADAALPETRPGEAGQLAFFGR